MNSDRGACWQKAVIQAEKQRISQEINEKLHTGISRYGQICSVFLRVFFFFCGTICKYKNDRDTGGLINGDSFTVSSGCTEILIREPKMKSM